MRDQKSSTNRLWWFFFLCGLEEGRPFSFEISLVVLPQYRHNGQVAWRGGQARPASARRQEPKHKRHAKETQKALEQRLEWVEANSQNLFKDRTGSEVDEMLFRIPGN
jgi:hypothetical protein